MAGISNLLTQGSRAASYVLGSVVIVAAVAAWALSRDAGEVAGWALDVPGTGFLGLLGSLVLIAVFAQVRLREAAAHQADFWLEAGLQAASGVTTLALTFTLLGISLGIGGLAGQSLTPDTVQDVIRDLTANFSLAFMTTVVGLPVSAVLRAVLILTHERRRAAARGRAS